MSRSLNPFTLTILLLFFSTAAWLQSSSCPLVSGNILKYPTCAAMTPDRQYWYLNHLGFGSASSVIKARSLDSTPKTVAIKVFDPKTLQQSRNEYTTVIYNEYHTMRSFQVLRIDTVRTEGLIEHDDRFFLVMEYCPMTLMNQLETRVMSEEEVENIWVRILHIVHGMHENGIAHRDLKAGNILLCDDGMYKLGDLGSATRFQTTEGRTLLSSGMSQFVPTILCLFYIG